MANTTFSGAVRSENNFKLISKTASTGVVADQTIGGGLRDARRYHLDDYFNQLPALNAYLQQQQPGGMNHKEKGAASHSLHHQ